MHMDVRHNWWEFALSMWELESSVINLSGANLYPLSHLTGHKGFLFYLYVWKFCLHTTCTPGTQRRQKTAPWLWTIVKVLGIEPGSYELPVLLTAEP